MVRSFSTRMVRTAEATFAAYRLQWKRWGSRTARRSFAYTPFPRAESSADARCAHAQPPTQPRTPERPPAPRRQRVCNPSPRHWVLLVRLPIYRTELPRMQVMPRLLINDIRWNSLPDFSSRPIKNMMLETSWVFRVAPALLSLPWQVLAGLRYGQTGAGMPNLPGIRLQTGDHNIFCMRTLS